MLLSRTLIKYVSIFQHKIDKDDLRIFLESSPQYPNLLSVMQTLKYAGLNVHAGQCDWESLPHLESPFLIHIKVREKEVLVITEWDNSNNCVRVFNLKEDRWEIKPKEYIESIWDRVVIYTDDNPIKHGFNKNAIFVVLAAIFMFLVFGAVRFEGITVIYFVPVFIGLMTSLYLYSHKWLYENPIIDKLCKISPIIDCNTIEKSSYSSIFGLRMGCMALAYFLSQIICMAVAKLLDGPDSLYTIYFISAIVIIPIAIYSVYGQIRLKKVCPLCILVLICVLTETILFISMMPSYKININLIILWGGIALVSLSIFQYVSNMRLTRQEYFADKIQSLRLKRKKEIVLHESRDVGLVLSPIWLGKADASLNITTIISTNCGHCRNLVAKILKLLDKGFEFRWNIILGSANDSDLNDIYSWIQQYITDKSKFLEYIQVWSNYKTSTISIPKEICRNVRISQISRYFDGQISAWGIIESPRIIINNQLLSCMYSSKDIEFLIIDKTEEIQ